MPTNSTGNPTQIILVDPVDGAVMVSIPFIAKDNAGIVSTGSGSANLPFTVPALVGPTANDDNATTPMNTPVDINALQMTRLVMQPRSHHGYFYSRHGARC